jgi:hypothetical protein
VLKNETARSSVKFVALTGLLSFLWFVAATLFLDKRDVSPLLILNAIALGFVAVCSKRVLGLRDLYSILIMLVTSPFFLLMRPLDLSSGALSLIKTFPEGWIISFLSLFWLPPLISYYLVFVRRNADP